jgi:hypothetical protein
MKKLFLGIGLFILPMLAFYGCSPNNSGFNLPGGTNTFNLGGSGVNSSQGPIKSDQALTPAQLPSSDSQLAPHAPDQIIIQYQNVNLNTIAASVKATVVRTFSIGMNQLATLQIPSNASIVQTIKQLKTNPDIVHAEPNWYRYLTSCSAPYPCGSGYTQYQWGPKAVQATSVWSGGAAGDTGDPSVVIGIMDTGVNGAHQDFDNTIGVSTPITIPAGFQNVLAGFDYADNFTGSEGSGTTSCPSGLTAAKKGGCYIPAAVNSDQVGHGTLVASTAAAQGDNGDPTGVAGICWNCTIEPIKIFGSNGTFTTTDLEVQALADAANSTGTVSAAGVGSPCTQGSGTCGYLPYKPDVINMSFGGPVYSNIEVEGIDYALQRGITLVAAAGNSANADYSFPAAYPGVIAAGAIQPNDTIAPFSTQGPFVSLVAPGVQMYGASNTGNSSYQEEDGTSFASPTTSGTVGLLDSIILEAGGTLPTSGQIATILDNNTTKLAGMGGSNWTQTYGYGLLNVLAASQHTSAASNMGTIEVTVDVSSSTYPVCDWDVLLENSSGQAITDTLTSEPSSSSPLGTTNFTPGTAYFFLVPAGTYTVVVQPPSYASGISGFPPSGCWNGSSPALTTTSQQTASVSVTAGAVSAKTFTF